MIRVQREDFDVGAEIESVGRGRTGIGGIASFIGLVRDVAGGQAVGAMTLEHYPGMTERQLAAIEAEARRRWPLEEVLIIHRYGRLEPGDRIVLVVTASAHRQAAFESCHFLIDWLKTKAPFWKLEETPYGPRWVEAQASDDHAAERWVENKQPPHEVEGPARGPEDIDHAGTGGPYGHTVPDVHPPQEDAHTVFIERTGDNYRNGIVAGEMRDWIDDNIRGRVTCEADRERLRFTFAQSGEAASFRRRWHPSDASS